MADVFVSYARVDKARVAPIVAAIEAQGWTVWWDPEIAAGQLFDDQIETQLAGRPVRAGRLDADFRGLSLGPRRGPRSR